jgi:hypothetical protein
MSNLVKSKNMSKIKKQLWHKKMKYYIRLVMESHMVGSDLLPYFKEMFEYLLGDLWWLNYRKHKKVIKRIKEKLEELKDITVSPCYREYFRNVEENFGFSRYCCSNTGKYRCENTIIKGEKNNYCKLHKKILDIKSERISEVIGSSDMSMLIAQYI